MNTLNYRVTHDQHRPLVFVGKSFHNNTMYEYFRSKRPCLHITYEEMLEKPKSWFKQHQFMCSMSNIAFKKKVCQELIDREGDFFSVVSEYNAIGNKVKIGKGVFVNHFNVVYDDAVIGDHVTISTHIQISHESAIGDFCHISPYVYMCYTALGQGNFVGMRTGFFGYPEKRISTPNFCNFIIDSRVTEPTPYCATWNGKKKFDSRSSLELAL